MPEQTPDIFDSPAPAAAVAEVLGDLTEWMLKYEWMTGLSADQTRQVCAEIVQRVLEGSIVAIRQQEAERQMGIVGAITDSARPWPFRRIGPWRGIGPWQALAQIDEAMKG